MQKVVMNEVNSIGISEIDFKKTQCLGSYREEYSDRVVYLCDKANNSVTIVILHWYRVDGMLCNNSSFLTKTFDEWMIDMVNNKHCREFIYFPEHISEALAWLSEINPYMEVVND